MALKLAAQSRRPGPGKAQGVQLPKIERTVDATGIHYATVDVQIDRDKRVATITAKAPASAPPQDVAAIEAAGAAWWPLQFGRELDDAILHLRTNELDVGVWVLKTRGSAANVLAADRSLMAHANHWLVRETIGLLRRTLARLDVSSRSLFAVIDEGSAFAGMFAEFTLAADRGYMLVLPEEPEKAPTLTLSDVNFGLFPMVTGQSRLARRFYDDAKQIDAARAVIGKALSGVEALRLGLVTVAPDDIDWEDELRIALEERVALSPDALTGMEANLRFNGTETMWTRVFGRLTAWQNWIFNRPNAVGKTGALKVYGTGERPKFDFERV
jgi:benzoyl-CoA-dihydrodiol lyase